MRDVIFTKILEFFKGTQILSQLTSIMFYMELTHLGLEASK